MEHKKCSFQKFEKTFKALKENKAIGSYDLNGNIIVDVHDSIKIIHLEIFKASLKEAVFPEKLKIAKVIPVFQKKLIKKILKTTNKFLFFSFFQSA